VSSVAVAVCADLQRRIECSLSRGVRMTSIDQNRFLLPAWGFSLLLHGLAVVLAVIFAAQIKPVLKEEAFKWDVALVDAVRTESLPESAQPVAPQAQSKPVVTRPSRSTRETALNRVAPHQSGAMVHPEIQTGKPSEQKADLITPPQFEPVEPQMTEVRPQTHEPIEQKAVEVPKPEPQPVLESEKPEPAQKTEPVIAQRQAVAPLPPAEVKEDRVAQAAVSETPAVEPVREASIQNPTQPATSVEPTTASPPKVGLPEAPSQAAQATPGPDTKLDRWVGESLWRRVGELKRYPASARLNGQEGKVILKAVIRADGHLAEVSVQKSSGHHILDTAAMEAVRLACPLHMKHAISKSEIVVRLPIVYSLAN
jgi:periplasmic protein TonB